LLDPGQPQADSTGPAHEYTNNGKLLLKAKQKMHRRGKATKFTRSLFEEVEV
jgi:hypothetical protein